MVNPANITGPTHSELVTFLPNSLEYVLCNTEAEFHHMIS